jgi:Gpi18-like mannosyltransferase
VNTAAANTSAARAAHHGLAWADLAWRPGVLCVLIVGLLVRVPLLGLDSGVYDAAYFRNLMHAAGTDLTSAYDQVSPDYPPLMLLVFGLTGRLAGQLSPVVAAKLPEVVASLGLAGLIGGVVWSRSGGAPLVDSRGLWRWGPGAVAVSAAAAYALNPGEVYVSAYWTQAEAVWVLPVALGFLALERRAFVLAWMAFTAAALTKPQAAAFVPLLLVGTWRDAPRSVWLSGPLAAIGVTVVVCAPWGLTGHAADVAQVYLGLSGADGWVSGSAYSLWYLLLLGRTHQVPADSPLVAGLTYQHVGWLLFALLVAWVVWQAGRGASLYLAAATLWLGLAVLLTQTHERYFHPVLALLLLAPELYVARSRLWLVWLAVTLAYAYNLITVLPFNDFPGPGLIAQPDGGLRVLVLRMGSLVAAATFLAALAILAARLRQRADEPDTAAIAPTSPPAAEPAWHA